MENSYQQSAELKGTFNCGLERYWCSRVEYTTDAFLPNHAHNSTFVALNNKTLFIIRIN